ncbi:hypothetical protein JCM9957A_67980 [Kineosporia succinea]
MPDAAQSSPGTASADAPVPDPEAPAPTTRRRATRTRTAKKAVASDEAATDTDSEADATSGTAAPVKRVRAPRKRTAAKRVAATEENASPADAETAAVIAAVSGTEVEPAAPAAAGTSADQNADQADDTADALFAEPVAPAKKTTRRRSSRKASAPATRAAEPLEASEAGPQGETDETGIAPAGTESLDTEPLSTEPLDTEQPPARAGRGSRRATAAQGSTRANGATRPDTSASTPDASATGTTAPDVTTTSAGTATDPATTADEPAPAASPVTQPFSAQPETGETTAARSRPRTRVRSAAERAADAAAEEEARANQATEADQADEQVAPTRPAGIMPIFQAPEPAARRSRRAASRPAGPPKPVELTKDEEADEILSAQDAAEEATGLLEGPAADAAENDDATSSAADLTDEELDELDGTEEAEEADEADDDNEDGEEGDEQEEAVTPRRRRRRGGRGRRGRSRGDAAEPAETTADAGEQAAAPEVADEAEEPEESDDESDGGEEAGESTGSRRRRRRRRRGSGGTDGEVTVDDGGTTVVTKVRESRESRRSSGGTSSDDVTSVRGSTRLEAKKQRRREGREAGRRRTILTEAEFLARRESVERTMVVRERDGRTQIGVLEDGVLVEHYVARKTQTSTVGNVYLGRVQNVLPSMEAAFVDIGKGRNAVLYAGEVNWDAAGMDGQPRRIEHALHAGDSVLVQVTKDPIGHKGARLTSQISMPGRYLVYVPDGSMTGISRKLPDTERTRLKKILREVVPDNAGVIVRTAAEGASDEELERDVQRLQAQWEDIHAKVSSANAPAMLYGEPDLAIKVVRDVFNEDFSKLIISGDEAWETLHGYIQHVAPDLVERLQHWDGEKDVFAKYRIDEQLAKGLDRKVWLPSGGSLVIDRTEAMTVIDVNTGKFTGAGGNLEETVTKNNLEAAEEVVHQLRLRDIGGIIVVDFIDMVLESNRDLVLRRLLECLGRDRTRHQVAEVTSLGLVQMTRKRVGQGLLEVFSETCEHCGGRGLIMHDEPVEKKQQENGNGGGGGGRKGRNNHQH